MTILSKLEEVIKELERQKDGLVRQINQAGSGAGATVVLSSEIKVAYQRWYSAAHAIIAKNQSARLSEFEGLYSSEGWRIKNFLETPGIWKQDQIPMLLNYVEAQFGILAGVPEHLKYSMYDIELNVYSVLMGDEIEAARHLLENGFLRSAGALAGVVLERHLKNLLRKHDSPIQYPEKATLGHLNELCKGKVYDTAEASRVEVLNQLRIKCVHDKKRNPTRKK